MFETILEFYDDALVSMKVEIAHDLLRITEDNNRYIHVTAKGLARIAEAVTRPEDEVEEIAYLFSEIYEILDRFDPQSLPGIAEATSKYLEARGWPRGE